MLAFMGNEKEAHHLQVPIKPPRPASRARQSTVEGGRRRLIPRAGRDQAHTLVGDGAVLPKEANKTTQDPGISGKDNSVARTRD